MQTQDRNRRNRGTICSWKGNERSEDEGRGFILTNLSEKLADGVSTGREGDTEPVEEPRQTESVRVPRCKCWQDGCSSGCCPEDAQGLGPWCYLLGEPVSPQTSRFGVEVREEQPAGSGGKERPPDPGVSFLRLAVGEGDSVWDPEGCWEHLLKPDAPLELGTIRKRFTIKPIGTERQSS
ncbi:hypothetical protein JRQ81_007677 [Phrynocephalus forsythii]|uniref:Uncharacterized protein n=1 Tax=Phrynocephalus forsythii TaxID=171643 RepID=A0A9Q1ASY9_9SAUR|nr:hypothetical protein JRQ81_007677 [Phrynocephalus forsythii]